MNISSSWNIVSTIIKAGCMIAGFWKSVSIQSIKTSLIVDHKSFIIHFFFFVSLFFNLFAVKIMIKSAPITFKYCFNQIRHSTCIFVVIQLCRRTADRYTRAGKESFYFVFGECSLFFLFKLYSRPFLVIK